MAPYFERRQKLKAVIVIDEAYPTLKMTYWAWKVIRLFSFSVYLPQFIDVQKNTLRKIEEAFKLMTNHVARLNADDEKGIGGGVQGIIVDQNLNYFDVRVFPRSDKYHIIIERDPFGAVTINVPAMKFTDRASMNQARKVIGQCVQLATGLGG